MSDMERLWDLGQRHLAGGRYVSARRWLERAEAIAWRERDARSLARLYLPLLEARRQIRYLAVEGAVVVLGEGGGSSRNGSLSADFFKLRAGTLMAAGPGAGKLAVAVEYAQRRTGAAIEALVLVSRGGEKRIAAAGDLSFAGGLPVKVTEDAKDVVRPVDFQKLVVPLPGPGAYGPGDAMQVLARESLLIGWEALALKWQARHEAGAGPWEEMAWLRGALRIDPACEPASMRLIAVAEGIVRRGE